jgi:hypothetical protein
MVPFSLADLASCDGQGTSALSAMTEGLSATIIGRD